MENDTRYDDTTVAARRGYGRRPTGAYAGGGGYGYGGGFGQRRPMPIETKPFFLTSEFFGTLLAIVALAIGAATVEDVDSRLFWTLTTALVAAYVLSRGIAKSGTKSQSWDPREDLFRPGNDDE
jgi:hypothetical protein